MNKTKVLSSLFWKLMERGGTQGIQFIVQIVLARLLLPEEFGIIALIAIFITIATAWAMNIGAKIIAYGAHTGDNNYPDCRPEFTKSISKTLNLGDIDGISSGLRKKVSIWSPAIDGLDKPKLIRIGYEILGDKIFETWSCYSNCIDTKNGKKIHCGICESCINRRRAFRNVSIDDKTEYANH